MNLRKFFKESSRSAFFIPVIYSAFGIVYIYVSYLYFRSSLTEVGEIDLLINLVFVRVAFIAVSAMLLYLLIWSFHKKLQGSASQSLKLFRENPNPMWVFDTKTLGFLAVNNATVEKYGYTEEEFLSMTIKEIRPEEDFSRLVMEKSFKTGFNLSGVWRHRLKNGSLIYVEVSTHTLMYEGREAKLTLAYDVTERVNHEHQIIELNHTLEQRVNERTRDLHEALREQATLNEEIETTNEELITTNEQLMSAQNVIREQAETRLRQSQYRLEQVLKSVDDFIWSAQLKNGTFHVEMMSPAVKTIMGFSKDDYMNDHDIWFGSIAEQDQERVKKLIANLGAHPYEEIEYCIRHKETWQVKYVLSRIWITQIEEHAFQLTGIISDVSERKKQEEEKSSLIKQLINQNNDLMQFSYIASHNLRGPVATLLGLINLIEKEEKPSDIKAISTHLLYSTRKLDDVILDLNKILEIRNIQSLPKEKVSVHDIFDNVKSILLQGSRNNIVIETDFSACDTFFTIKSYLHSILYNLISNAIKYRSPDRPVIIKVSTFKNTDTTGLIVSDNGLGLEVEKFQHKLFKLYQRFHTHVEGKGLGLYLVKTQTLALGGDIQVESTPGQGTTFTITLPMYNEILINS